MAFLLYDDEQGLREAFDARGLQVGGFCRPHNETQWYLRIAPTEELRYWTDATVEQLPAKMRTEALLLGIHL